MKSLIRKKSIGILVCLVIMIHPAMVFAQDAKLKNIIVTNTRDDLLIYLTVEGAFRENMETAISSGVPATFSSRDFINVHRNSL